MQPIELDGIKSGAMQSVQAAAQLRVKEQRELPISAARPFELWGEPRPTGAVPGGDPQGLGETFARVTQDVQRIYDFLQDVLDLDIHHVVATVLAAHHDLG
ncbi:hypothetical protein [Kitasatospora sp. NPDC101183]|uniref:hypothetical protein n=1 Tax=Kitasatospora sp. NPDC101183 TaxID=3364100 RepID=UPI00381FCE60